MSLVRGQIDDFVVASFPCPPRTTATRATRTTVSPVSYTSSAKTEHRVAVASPRVGLAVYDLEDQTPLSSVSVGPSFAPTTAPAARSAPLSPTESESTRVKSLRKTWIGVESAAAHAADDAAAAAAAGAAEIWCFHEDENRDGSTPSADAAKAVWPISEPLAAIAAPRTLPNHIAFLSKNGNLALAPENDLTRLVSLAAPPLPANTSALVSQTLRLVPLSATATAADYLPASLLAALPTATASVPHLAIIVRSYASSAPEAAAPASLTGAGKKKHKKQSRPSAASVIEAAEAAAPSAAAPSSVPHVCEIELVLLDAAISIPDEFEPRQGMIRLGRVIVEGASQAVVSDEGFVTALDADGTLSSYRLGFSSALAVDTYPTLFFPSTTSSTDALSPLLELSLSRVKSIALSKTTLIPSRTSLLALHSSFVALASPRPRPASSVAADSSAAAGVSVTYWDTRFGSVIAATELAVPSAVASNPNEVSVSLSKAGRRTAIVVLEPEVAEPSTESSSSAVATSAATAVRRTVLFGLPLNGLPSASVLAAVVGKQTLTARYIASTPDPSAASAASAPASPAAVVLDRARRAEPLRSELARHGNEKKAALLEASRLAREEVLASLAAILEPLRNNADGSAAGSVEEQDQAVHKAETVWELYIETERDRLLEYNRNKVRLAMEKEKERRMAALGGGGTAAGDVVVEGSEAGEVTGYKAAKRRIERALAAAGAPVRPTSAAGEGEKSWKEVTAARIKGVNDKYRYRYHLERNKKEAEMGKTVKEFDWEEAVNKVERYEPPLPSSFVTALLCLSFPVPLADPSAAVEIAALPAPGAPKNKKHNAPAVWRHPTAMVGYLLGREIVGENQVEGGVTRFLARAGDWTNILVALRTIPDIPESTLVSLLVAVVRDGARTTAAHTDGMDVDTPSSSKKTLPTPVPSLASFLAAFLQSPHTPAVLRQALQKQLSADEAVIVLEQCDAWLKRWLSEAEPVDASSTERKRKGKGSQAVAVDVFKVAVPATDVPSMDQIVPFVQAVLDAHFVNLLLQRQSHRLLRRLSRHVARHAEMTNDLGTLLGVLSIYSSKKKEEQRRSAAVAAASAALKVASAPAGKGLASVKEFGATMEKRILAQEKHAAVGQYQVEEFFL